MAAIRRAIAVRMAVRRARGVTRSTSRGLHVSLDERHLRSPYDVRCNVVDDR